MLCISIGASKWSLSNHDGDDIRIRRKAIGSRNKTTTHYEHHINWYISLLTLYEYDVKFPIMLTSDLTNDDYIFFLFLNLNELQRILPLENLPAFDKLNDLK